MLSHYIESTNKQLNYTTFRTIQQTQNCSKLQWTQNTSIFSISALPFSQNIVFSIRQYLFSATEHAASSFIGYSLLYKSLVYRKQTYPDLNQNYVTEKYLNNRCCFNIHSRITTFCSNKQTHVGAFSVSHLCDGRILQNAGFSSSGVEVAFFYIKFKHLMSCLFLFFSLCDSGISAGQNVPVT